MSVGERRLAAIMFTDVVGYTGLTERNEARALSLLDEHRGLVRPLISAHAGKEIKTMGDAFLVEFPSALEAARCAFEIQQSTHQLNLDRPREDRILLRIGVHLGDIIHSQDDLYGDAVNVASRIEPLAEPGGVCISEQVYLQVKNKVPYSFRRLPQRDLKNVSEVIDLYMMVMPWHEEVPPQVPSIKHRIAVLPFTNISADSTDEYFADGMTEEVISTLSNIRSLSVISRTSVMYYKNAHKRVKEISKELNAGIILEGSVRKSADSMRITVQLIDAIEDRHLWAENYDRGLGDIFAVQGEIALHVAKALETELLSSAWERIERGDTGSTEAHTSYLRARYLMNRGTSQELLRAVEYLENSVREDAAYALAEAALSECYTYLAGTALTESEAFPKAREHALRAVELNGDLAEGHTFLAIIALQHDWDWVKAEKEFTRAIELNPSYSTAHLWYAVYLAITRRLGESFSEVRLAEILDPLSPLVKLNFGMIHYHAGDYNLAETKLRESLGLEENQLAHAALGLVYLQQARNDDALSEVRMSGAPDQIPFILGVLGYVQAVAGKKSEARETLTKLIGQEREKESFPTELAMIHIGLAENDRALELLERASNEKESWLVVTHGLPIYDTLRSNPRYVALVRRIGLAL